MVNSRKKAIKSFFIGLFLISNSIHSQTQSETAIYNWYDTVVGRENLDFNTGKIFLNPYKTTKNNEMFFKQDSFEKGSLTYEGKTYYETKLKYDIYRDILILNSDKESESTSISLNQEKVNSFSIYNKDFTKVNSSQYQHENFSTGYYETLFFTENFILYIKHHKNIQKIIKDNTVYFTFKNSNSFFLAYDKKVYEINSKKDIIKLFPDKKKQINDFYTMNNGIRKVDLDQFMKNLMQSVNRSLPKKEY